MSQTLDWNIMDALDEVSMELTSTSEFWTQLQYEVDGLDIVPPAEDQELHDSDSDWRILDAQGEEEEMEHKENIVHHDCMWAGSCLDSKHPSNTFVQTEFSASPGQSLLRRDLSPARPDTPPSLDGDEPPQFRHAVDVAGTALRILRTSAIVASDHSYTFQRQHTDHLGVQTPSDSCESEEEIDVVSLGTSAAQPLEAGSQTRAESLPRTPSALERRELQRSGSRAVSPQQRAPAQPRKRASPATSTASSSSSSGGRRRRGPGRRPRRVNTDTDSEAESPELERRSIHNDMERLRRIGLKNLFDDLKMQIPATRDKERAPKVVILREAAALCRKLREEDAERELLRRHQAKLLAKLRRLRTQLAARYRPY